jgi:hypothetical protein
MGGFSPGEHYPAAPGLIPHHATNSSLSTEGPWPPKDGRHSRVRTSPRFPLTPWRYEGSPRNETSKGAATNGPLAAAFPPGFLPGAVATRHRAHRRPAERLVPTLPVNCQYDHVLWTLSRASTTSGESSTKEVAATPSAVLIACSRVQFSNIPRELGPRHPRQSPAAHGLSAKSLKASTAGSQASAPRRRARASRTSSTQQSYTPDHKHCGSLSSLKQWEPSYDAGSKMQASLVALKERSSTRDAMVETA